MSLVELIAFVAIFATQTYAHSCRDVVDMKLHPIDCCSYPTLYDDGNVLNKCEQNCKSEPSKPYCPRVCFLKELDIYTDKKLKVEHLKNLFTNAGEPTRRGSVGENYKEILDESIKKCLIEQEVVESVEEENAAMVVFGLINCIRRHNFIACPDFKDNAECNEMKDAVKTCDKSTEDMLFGVFHEQRKADKEKGMMDIAEKHGKHAMGR